MSELTQLLKAIEGGEGNAADQLLPLVYRELRNLAAAKIAREKPGQTLQATALVHEAWMKLAGSEQQWQGRSHFYAAAAEAMRRILIDKARRKAALRHGAGVVEEELDESQFELKLPAEEFIAVHDAVEALAHQDPI